MAKSKAQKRKRQGQVELPQKSAKVNGGTITPPPDGKQSAAEPAVRSLNTLVDEEDLEATIDTLNTLAEHPNVIKSKQCKDLRTAVYTFRQACTTGVNAASETNLTSRISAALADEKYLDARILLAEMRIRGEKPKLGALCRWVRDLDVVSGLSSTADDKAATAHRSERDKELLRVMDSVLRVTGTIDHSRKATAPWRKGSVIALQEIWRIGNGDIRCLSLPVLEMVQDGSIFERFPAAQKSAVHALDVTPGPERKPPNHHPAILYTTEPGVVDIPKGEKMTSLEKHPVVPELSMILNVFTPRECQNIVAAAEAAGFIPDTPIRQGVSEAESSVLAHNFYWLIDEALERVVWERVREYVPEQVGGKKARCLNRRFRVYRYVPGAEYRAHIDGAWPPSGICPTSGKYVYDSSPPEAKQSSLFTFLIYLNADFEGGETTFFLPAAREGVLNAYPVKPVQGAVLMFPHGEGEDGGMLPLLHEGTGVKKGAKYVIRTDVCYDVDATV
jgi:hypothetical protein